MKELLKQIQEIQFSILENEKYSMSVASDKNSVLVFLHSREQDKVLYHWNFGFLKTEDKKQLRKLKKLCQK